MTESRGARRTPRAQAVGGWAIDARLRLAIRLAYVAMILIATLSGLAPDLDVARALYRLRRALAPPLGANDVLDAIRNVALFAGMGVAWLCTTTRRRGRDGLREATVFALLLSLTIELIQTISPRRTASIADVITDTLGAAIGAAIAAELIHGMRRSHGRASYFGVPAWLLAGAYGAAAWCEAAGPLFRQTRLPLTGGPLVRLRGAISLANLLPGSLLVWGDVALDAVLFAPAGALAVVALAELGVTPTRARWWIAAGGLIAAVGAEAFHGMLGQEIVPMAIVAHAVGIAFGAFAAARSLPSLMRARAGAGGLRTLYIAYGVLLAMWGARPFVPDFRGADVAEQMNATHWVPMLSLAARGDIYSVSHVGVECLLYVPLGALLAVWPLRRSGWLANLLPALYIAVAVELSHLIIVSRYFDSTNMLIDAAGAALGWLLARYGDFRSVGEGVWPSS